MESDMAAGLNAFSLDRQGDVLRLCWKSGWLMVGFLAGFSLGFVSGLLLWQMADQRVLGGLVAGALAVGGLLLGLSSRLVASFDVAARRLLLEERFALGVYRRASVIPFDNIAGLHIDEEVVWGGEGDRYLEVSLFLKSGATETLYQASSDNAGALAVFDEICAASGLQKLAAPRKSFV
jgi:hypothetical protein